MKTSDLSALYNLNLIIWSDNSYTYRVPNLILVGSFGTENNI